MNSGPFLRLGGNGVKKKFKNLKKMKWKIPSLWRDIPLPYRCNGCPYPRTGFVCYDKKDGTCMRTDVELISIRDQMSKRKG